LEEALGSFDLPQLSAGIAFLGQLSPSRAEDLLASLHERLSANKEFLQKLGADMPDDQAVPRTVDLLDLWASYLEATARSVNRLKSKIAREHAVYPPSDDHCTQGARQTVGLRCPRLSAIPLSRRQSTLHNARYGAHKHRS